MKNIWNNFISRIKNKLHQNKEKSQVRMYFEVYDTFVSTYKDYHVECILTEIDSMPRSGYAFGMRLSVSELESIDSLKLVQDFKLSEIPSDLLKRIHAHHPSVLDACIRLGFNAREAAATMIFQNSQEKVEQEKRNKEQRFGKFIERYNDDVDFNRRIHQYIINDELILPTDVQEIVADPVDVTASQNLAHKYRIELYNRCEPDRNPSCSVIDRSPIIGGDTITEIKLYGQTAHLSTSMVDIKTFENSSISLEDRGPWTVHVTFRDDNNNLSLFEVFNTSKKLNADHRFLRLRRDHKQIKLVDDQYAFSFVYENAERYTIFSHCVPRYESGQDSHTYVFDCFQAYTEKKEDK